MGKNLILDLLLLELTSVTAPGLVSGVR